MTDGDGASSEDKQKAAEEMGRLLNEAHERAQPAWEAFVAAAKNFGANHLDQWEKIKFQTPHGTVYVSISRAAEWPDDYQDVEGSAGEETSAPTNPEPTWNPDLDQLVAAEWFRRAYAQATRAALLLQKNGLGGATVALPNGTLKVLS